MKFREKYSNLLHDDGKYKILAIFTISNQEGVLLLWFKIVTE